MLQQEQRIHKAIHYLFLTVVKCISERNTLLMQRADLLAKRYVPDAVQRELEKQCRYVERLASGTRRPVTLHDRHQRVTVAIERIQHCGAKLIQIEQMRRRFSMLIPQRPVNIEDSVAYTSATLQPHKIESST